MTTSRLKKGVKSISAKELFAEWRNDPEYMREYEALEEEFAEVQQQIDARDAREARRVALVARLREGLRDLGRGFWHWLVPGRDRVAT